MTSIRDHEKFLGSSWKLSLSRDEASQKEIKQAIRITEGISAKAGSKKPLAGIIREFRDLKGVQLT